MLAGAHKIPEHQDQANIVQANQISVINFESQYVDLIFYLKNGYASSNLNYKHKHALRLKDKHYEIIDDVLFRRNYDSILLRCLEKTEAKRYCRNYMMDQ